MKPARAPRVDAADTLKRTGQLASIPAATARVLQMVDDPSCTPRDLEQVLRTDPALVTRILKVVNSPFYGRSREVHDLSHAIRMLGLMSVKNVAVAASMSRLFRGGDVVEGFTVRDLWHHSIAVAVICEAIAADEGADPGAAFLAGLIHDIGILAEIQIDPEAVADMVRAAPDERDAIERAAFAFDHAELGAHLAESWRFPTSLVAACAHHHAPGDDPLARAVARAEAIAASLSLGICVEVTSSETPDEPARSQLQERIGAAIASLDA